MFHPSPKRLSLLLPMSFTLLVSLLASVLSAGAASAQASDAVLEPELICQSSPNGDGTTSIYTLTEDALPYRATYSIRRNTTNGSEWVATDRETEPGFGFAVTTDDTDAGFFARLRHRGVIYDQPCSVRLADPLAPVCSVEGWSQGSDAYWSVLVESQDDNAEFTLFVNDEEIESADESFTNPVGTSGEYFSLSASATPALKIEVSPTAAQGSRTLCGTVQEDLQYPGACDVQASDWADDRLWIDVDVNFPRSFAVLVDGVDVGEAYPISFADHPLSYLEPASYYEVPGNIDEVETVELRFDGFGLVCTGFGGTAFQCSVTGNTITYTDVNADHGKYQLRRVVGASTTWERVMVSFGNIGEFEHDVAVADGDYMVRWRKNGVVHDGYCS